MIFEDHSGAAAAVTKNLDPPSAREILAACVAEAERQAMALGVLDDAVGRTLADTDGDIDSQSLQSLDLLRQEAEGLANMLKLVVAMPSPETVVDDAAIASCVPLAAQRARFIA